MTETLTESFCERCGTRYTFESAAPRGARLKGVKVLSRGFKNFVMSDDTSLDEAMAAARSETDREVTSQQLDAFHKTFNFCMECRQYTCGNCWNEADGKCLSCAPHLGHDIMPSPFPDLDGHVEIHLDEVAANGTNGTNGSAVLGAAATTDIDRGAMAWPSSDFLVEAETSDDAAATSPVPDGIDAAGPVDAADATDPDGFEPIDLEARFALLDQISPTGPIDDIAPPPLAPEIEVGSSRTDDADAGGDALEVSPAATVAPADADPAVAERAAAAAGQTSDMLHRFRPGQSLDDEIEAYEREQAALAASAAALVAAASVGDQPDEVPTTEIAAAAVQAPEPTPAEESIAAAASATPPAATEPSPPTASDSASESPLAAEPVTPAPETPVPAARQDIVPQPTWQMVAPDITETPSVPPTPATPPAEPQWPSQPEWPSQRPSAGLPFLARQTSPNGALDSLWAESAREVASPPAQPGAADKTVGGVAPCVSCGLSLSANARFCRRCGTRQG